MIDVVAVHGIGMHRASRTAMHVSWRDALVRGLADIRSPHAGSLTVECAFYGHEYNDGKAGGSVGYTAVDVEPGFETDLLVAIGEAWDEPADEPTKLYLPGAVQRALARIQRSGWFEGRDGAAIAFVKQANRYLSDVSFRDRVVAEMAAAMERSPRVVIGHSLGSVIAYDWLRSHEVAHPPPLLTVGSPLGLEAIRRRLAPRGGRPRWPGDVPSWTNIAAKQDGVALVKLLAPLFDPRIEDLPCDNPRRAAHAAVSYLSNVRTARTLDRLLR